MTYQQNSISDISLDGVSINVEAFSWNGSNYWSHKPKKSRRQIANRIILRCPITVFLFFFLRLYANANTQKVPQADFAKERWQRKAVAERLNSVCTLRKIPVWIRRTTVFFPAMRRVSRNGNSVEDVVRSTCDSTYDSLPWSWCFISLQNYYLFIFIYIFHRP